MTEADIKALERRNSMNQDLIIGELKVIRSITKSNERSLRGSNGEVGLIADMKIINSKLDGIKEKLGKSEKKHKETHDVLFGEGKDSVGIIGEQIALRNYVFKDLKPAIQKLSWWFFALVVGLILTGVLNALLFSR